MTDHQCPRRAENPGHQSLSDHDTWREDNTCSYCGSLNPDVFMARLEAGDVELIPTDKNYKVYVYNDGGEWFTRLTKQSEGNWLSEWT